MVTTVYLVRHGRTALNAAGLLRGRIDAPLDDAGRAEAARLGAFLAPVRLDRVVSSPLSRSVDTARAVAQPHGLPVELNAAFIDRDYGPWAGQSQADVEARYGSMDNAPENEVEPQARFEDRVVSALEGLVAQSEGQAVAVVAHDAVNRALIRALCSAWRGPACELPQPTGCWNRLVFDGGDAICRVVGAVAGDGTEA
jgi:glucosyl-3-phosphoglycerate phosphatase